MTGKTKDIFGQKTSVCGDGMRACSLKYVVYYDDILNCVVLVVVIVNCVVYAMHGRTGQTCRWITILNKYSGVSLVTYCTEIVGGKILPRQKVSGPTGGFLTEDEMLSVKKRMLLPSLWPTFVAAINLLTSSTGVKLHVMPPT